MGNIGDAISEILSKLTQLLGIKSSDDRRLELVSQKLSASRASNVDQLEALKSKIKQYEAQALRKKKEYEESTGDTKRIVGGEIERLFRDLDRLHGQESIISSNIERTSVAHAKLEELMVAQTSGIEEGELDDIASDLQEVFDDLKVSDRASHDLDRVKYQAPEPPQVNKEGRMAEVAGEQEAVGISAETEERLRQLIVEEE